MSNIENRSAEVEQKQRAQANNSDISKSADEECSVSESGVVDNEIPNQAKDKAHCFCPDLAKIHGEEAAVIFQGLGYKVARSKKVRDGRKWHYDTLETLEKQRWPYLRDSGIGGILDRKTEEGFVFKGCYNKWAGDRTIWYSLVDDLVSRALEEDGKMWFDVPVAIKCRSIINGTLYHNLRYQLLLFLAKNGEFEGVAYWKVNKAALARVLPWSLSSIKRGYAELLEVGLIAVNPQCSREYTLCNGADLIVPVGMMTDNPGRINGGSSRIGSSMEKNGSSTETKSVSFTEMTGSSTEQIGSSTEEIGSSTEHYTHCKPLTKTIHKHHSPTALPCVVGVCANAAGAARTSVNQQGSAPVPGKESRPQTAASMTKDSPLAALDRINHRIGELTPRLLQDDSRSIAQWASSLAVGFVKDDLSYKTLQAIRTAKDSHRMLEAVLPTLRQKLSSHAGIHSRPAEVQELWELTVAKIVLAAFLLNPLDLDAIIPKVEDCTDAVSNCYNALPKPVKMANASPGEKVSLLVSEIEHYNREEWPVTGDGAIAFKMPISSALRKAALAFFEQHAELSAQDVALRMSDCIEVVKLKEKPNSFDPLWKTRQGIRYSFLFKYWDEITLEVETADSLH